MNARDRLAAVLAPDVVAALEELVTEQVAEAAAAAGNGDRSPWLSVRDAAGYLGVSERTLNREIARGRVRSETVGRRRILHRDELDNYMKGDGGGVAPAAPPRRPEGV